MNYRDIVSNSLWKQNPGLVQLLGLCPLLAMSNSIVNAAGLGIATILVMALSSGMIALLRGFIPYEIRIPVFILVIAALVTGVDLAMNAWLHKLYNVLGIFIPLIVTNCIVLARVEAFAAKNPPLAATLDGAMMGLGLTLVLVALGAVREFVGGGTLFAGIEMVIPGARAVQVLPADYPGFLVAILPPGAFFSLAFLIALRNWIDARASERAKNQPPAAAPALEGVSS
ncbi:putative inner membrane NADH-quinone reductase [Sterolibacterium denitrificans]|uniref:Ion-translocating oxidoreductase complex subunit E n=2 Tax=Sterolibacterium denitrificans TaxID=157592 RepID=A0A656Z814_9PROT|nr:electron transport complex subunit E [Sterolibacterium denitrificans]KYC29154.1 electron transport complex RsxE subunit [Sterolibacterium denitrificans]SMB29291.1 putative inner membrane NADH-quinone reductase [Sterolibacterium denitrificans]